ECLEPIHRLGEPPLLLSGRDGALLGLLFGRQRRAGGPAAGRWRGPGSWRLEERLHGLQAQFGRAEIDLHHVVENVVSRSRYVVEAVGCIDADLYAAENRVGFGGPTPCCGQCQQGQFADVAPGVSHGCSDSMIACFAEVIKLRCGAGWNPAADWQSARSAGSRGTLRVARRLPI